MKRQSIERPIGPVLASWLLICLGVPGVPHLSLAGSIPLRLEVHTGTAILAIPPLPQGGALFVLAAPDLLNLRANPKIILQTNTPLGAELTVPIPMADGLEQQACFRAVQWVGVAPALADIPAGTFLMGSSPAEVGQGSYDGPQTLVQISYAFRMGRYEITQGEYQALMGTNPSYYSGASNRPVEQVAWTNAVEYCNRLTASQRQAGCLPLGWSYRLPTEAEWEYACRAGTRSAFSYGDELRSGMANFNGRQEYNATNGTSFNPGGVAIDRPTFVGGFAPNAWGLFDMHGNLWEWCQDGWSYYLPGGSVTNPLVPATGTDRVVRGGCFYSDGRMCRSGSRVRGLAAYRGNDTGFRIVLVPPMP